MSERWANPEEIISVPVWTWDRLGHWQEVAVRPMGERRGRNHEIDEAPFPKPPAEAGPSKVREGTRAQGQLYAAREWKNCFKERRRASNNWKRLNAAHGTQASQQMKLHFARGDAATAGNVVPGGVARDAADGTVMWEGADGRRTRQDDEEETTAHGEDIVGEESGKCGEDQGQPKNSGLPT